METVLLYVHILAAATWFGGNVVQLVVNPVMQRSGADAAAVWMRQTVRMGRIVYTPAAIVLLITGLWMVAISDVYEFENVFVVIGVLAVVAGALLGIMVFGPGGERAATEYVEGDAGRASALSRRLYGFGVLDTLILLFTIWAMVNRLGA